MQVSLAHAHIYEDHYEIANICIGQRAVVPQMQMPGWTVEEVEVMRDRYVEMIRSQALAHDWPEYNPKPFVVE